MQPVNEPSPPKNAVDAFFKISERGSTIFTEIRAGCTTFLTLCYILAVNARLLGDSGGPCECSEALKDAPGCQFFDPEYQECLEDFRRQLVTVTAVSAGVACMLMGLGANLPFALAPGMGLNAYFTYDVVGVRGTGNIPWKTALAAVFIEGIVFFVLTVTGLRVLVAKLIPNSLKLSMTGGIGFFLAHLGLQTAEGIGLVVSDLATGLTLGGCPPETRRYVTMVTLGSTWPTPEGMFGGGCAQWDPANQACLDDAALCMDWSTNPGFRGSPITSDAYTCDPPNPGDLDERMLSATTWLGICTVFIIGVLLKNKINGAIIMGVLFASVISWFKGSSQVSYFRDEVYPLGGTGSSNGGEYRWDYFKQVAKVESMSMTAGQMDFDWDGGNLGLALFTFLYVDSLDTMGTLFAMAKFAGLLKPNGDFEGSTRAFMVDSFTTSFGALLGTSPVTTYIESAPGIEEGGRTGLVAMVVGFLFFLCCFFAPIFASIPPWATGPALIVVGAMMMRPLAEVEWNDYGQAIPAFVTVALMPLTYSIAYGIIGGLMCYVAINGLDFIVQALLGNSPWTQPGFQAFLSNLKLSPADIPLIAVFTGASNASDPPTPPTASHADNADDKTRDVPAIPMQLQPTQPELMYKPDQQVPAPQQPAQYMPPAPGMTPDMSGGYGNYYPAQQPMGMMPPQQQPYMMGGYPMMGGQA